MKKTIVTSFVAANLLFVTLANADNLASNGSLDTDTQGWGTRLLKLLTDDPKGPKDVDKEAAKEGRFMTYDGVDGANGTKGCLKIDMEVVEGYSKHPSEVGIFARIQKVPGSEGAPARVKVSFFAKSPDDVVRFVRVGRLGSGGGNNVFPVTSEWQKFEFVLSAINPIDGVLFSPSNKYGNTIVPGPLLIDEVTVEDASAQ
jgi:hypothetical protein